MTTLTWLIKRISDSSESKDCEIQTDLDVFSVQHEFGTLDEFSSQHDSLVNAATQVTTIVNADKSILRSLMTHRDLMKKVLEYLNEDDIRNLAVVNKELQSWIPSFILDFRLRRHCQKMPFNSNDVNIKLGVDTIRYSTTWI